MPIIAFVEILVQVYFAVHAGRTGRYWWIFPILSFPFFGSVIYFFVEYWPDMQASARIRKGSTRKKSIKQLHRELEMTDSIKNRINLAEAYFSQGYFQASIDLLEKCLEGVNAKDLHIIEGLCLSHFHNGTYEKALVYLEQYAKLNDGTLKSNLRLIKAKAYEKMGNVKAALEEYHGIADICHGEEARCQYALLLKQQGHLDKARALFEQILKNARLYPKHYSRFEKEWVKIARAEVKQ